MVAVAAANLGAFSMLRERVLLPRTLILGFSWTMVALVYYGISMSMTVLGGNIFINFSLSAVFEILGYVLCMTLSDHWGRKPVIVAKY